MSDFFLPITTCIVSEGDIAPGERKFVLGGKKSSSCDGQSTDIRYSCTIKISWRGQLGQNCFKRLDGGSVTKRGCETLYYSIRLVNRGLHVAGIQKTNFSILSVSPLNEFQPISEMEKPRFQEADLYRAAFL